MATYNSSCIPSSIWFGVKGALLSMVLYIFCMGKLVLTFCYTATCIYIHLNGVDNEQFRLAQMLAGPPVCANEMIGMQGCVLSVSD